MVLHEIELEPGNTHGQFSRDMQPVLTINSGDQVKLKTVDVSWGIEQHGPTGSPRKRLKELKMPIDDGPALTGPIAINQAHPGNVLEIRFKKIVPGTWGWTFAGSSYFNKDLLKKWKIKDDALVRWDINSSRTLVKSEDGIEVQTHPFMGTVGMPSNVNGWQSGWLPRATGGNMDCKYMQQGSVLRLPVEVESGLLSFGDGHACQGNGEISGSAIECMMEEVIVEINVRDDIKIDAPQILFEDKIISLGFGKDLDKAIDQAIKGILRVIKKELNISSSLALAYTSTLVDLEITQIVNSIRGVHAVFDKGKMV
ncbi:MAG TPA: acetamidase/formamidase family protein [Balneolaceae bacterium]|nr:acetamidase/formamidase family protein [Balneolaceae bacterium]